MMQIIMQDQICLRRGNQLLNRPNLAQKSRLNRSNRTNKVTKDSVRSSLEKIQANVHRNPESEFDTDLTKGDGYLVSVDNNETGDFVSDYDTDADLSEFEEDLDNVDDEVTFKATERRSSAMDQRRTTQIS